MDAPAVDSPPTAATGPGAWTDPDAYPADWPAIAARIRQRSGGRCECAGECGRHLGQRCRERHRRPARGFRGRVQLSAAHLNHTPADCRDDNLLAVCQRCHLQHDRLAHHRAAAANRKRRLQESGQLALFEPPPPEPPPSEPPPGVAASAASSARVVAPKPVQH